MTKREGIMYALGQLKGYLEDNKDWRTVELKELFGDKYEGYELGFSNGTDSVCLLDVKSKESKFTRGEYIVELNRHLYVDDLVNMILEALASDMKRKG